MSAVAELDAWATTMLDLVAGLRTLAASYTRSAHPRPSTRRPRNTVPRLPFAPVRRRLEIAALEYQLRDGSPWRPVDRPSWVVMARVAGVDKMQLYRWRDYGVTYDQADELAVALGLHPLNVWPDWT